MTLRRVVNYPLRIEPINIVTAENEEGQYSKVAPHQYCVSPSNNPYQPIAFIQFQDGPLAEDHIDGVHNEDLLLVVLDRLRAFQKSEFSCRENAIAITKIEEAMNILCYRTQERKQRKVEGTNQI